MSKGARKLSILVLAGCMAAVAVISVFAGYGIGARRTTDGEAVEVAALHDEDAEPEAVEPVIALPEVESAAAPSEVLTAPASPSVRIIEPPPDTSDTIAIPGFKKLTAEGQTLNAGAITNPEQNTCYFIVSLIMPGGAEIYRSTYLAPGQSLGDVEMLVPLSSKVYEDVTARYSCYTMDDLKPLNGADIKFMLEVLP